MSPVMQAQDKRRSTADNVYTAFLAIAFLSVLAVAGFAAYMCYTQYGSIFKIAS